MSIQRRLTAWALEIFCEALGTVVILMAVVTAPTDYRHLVHEFQLSQFAGITFAVLAMFGMTGYVVTTGLVAAWWRTLGYWFYPAMSALLYVIHSQFFFWSSGGLNWRERWLISSFGACLAFSCAWIGNAVMKRRAGSL